MAPSTTIFGLSFPILLYSFVKSIYEGVLSPLQATYFDQQFSSTFFLHPEEAGLPFHEAAASASKSLQRLKRNPSQLSEAQATQGNLSSDRDVHPTRGGPESEQNGGGVEQRLGSHEAEQQQHLVHAGLAPDVHADGQRQGRMQLSESHRHEKNPIFHQSPEKEAEDRQKFSLDKYFLPLKKQPNGQAQHPTLNSPAQDEFLRGSPQDFGDTAMHLSSADAAGREIEEELLLTIEEQDQALG